MYRLSDGALVVDCQADFLNDIGSRFVIPLLPLGTGAPPNPRINPEVDVNGETLVVATQLAGPTERPSYGAVSPRSTAINSALRARSTY